MTKFDELKTRYPNLIPVQELRANVSIVELAAQYGYEPLPHKGRNRPVLTHTGYGDTIIIKNPQDAAQQVYQRSGDFTDAGTIIDFIRNRLPTVFSTFNRPNQPEFHSIVGVLYDYLRLDPAQVIRNQAVGSRLTEATGKQPFTKEQFDIRPLEPTNYLSQERHIAPATLQRPEFAGKVITQVTYVDPTSGHSVPAATARDHPEQRYLQFKNVAFPYYNGQSTEVTGLELRNTGGVKLHAPGSDRYGSVFVSNPPPKAERFYIMESVIDALSHRQLQQIHGDTAFNSVYFSTGGQLTPQQINTIARYVGAFERADNWQLRLSFDNDAKGHRYDLLFVQQMTAVKFPMSPTVAGPNQVAYLLPEQEAHQPIREALLNRIELYNADVQAQFIRSDKDTLGQKELNNQLINVSVSGKQIQVSIPEACAPLKAISTFLLHATGMEHRIQLDKACAKDWNLDLGREVAQSQRFRYAIRDETGQVLINGNSPVQMARSMQQLRHLAESGGLTKHYTLGERQPYGFRQPQVEVSVAQGICAKASQTPAFAEQLQAEKKRITTPASQSVKPRHE
jgi:hypothetical protein